LLAVVDTHPERPHAVAAEFGAEPAFDYRSILGKVDAASVAVPTPLHYEIARDLIQSGIHVLVEKPIADSVGSANALTSLAEQRKVVLQVGHIERFSGAYRTLAKVISKPLYFESYRISPWKNRGVEVDVILDLMIHDIDMIIGLVDSPVSKVDAVGTPVLGRRIDLANARINFESRRLRKRPGEPGELQNRTEDARIRTQPLSQLRPRRGAHCRLSPARRSRRHGARGLPQKKKPKAKTGEPFQ